MACSQIITNEPDSESSRLLKIKNCTLAVATQKLAESQANDTTCNSCPGAPLLLQDGTTTSELNYLLNKVSSCPLYSLNQIPPSVCPIKSAPNQGTLTLPTIPNPDEPYPYVTTPPGALHQYRSIPRIRGIDQITTVVRGQSSSEATVRRQQEVLRGHVASSNPFFRKQLPLPPCVVPFTPKPPYAAAPPCRPVKF
jgi:hypothetical protein